MGFKEFTKLEVGKPFELFQGVNLVGQTGAFLEALYGGGYMISIYLNNMTAVEKKALSTGTIKTKIFKDDYHLILPMVNFNNVLYFSLIFDPLKYKDDRQNTLFNSNLVTIVGIESNNNIVQTLRMANMPRRLFLALMMQRDKAKDIENYSKRYDRWVNDLYSRYTDEQLWNMAEYVGKMGE
jgi:hypothetical protein